MDRLLKLPASPSTSSRDVSPVPKRPRPSARQGDIIISAAFRAQQFSSTMYASGDNMLCRFYNVAVDHHRVFVVKRHLESKV